jgi:CheY-like chemotaxis protein
VLAGPVRGGEETVLVVEDDPAVQLTVVETLAGLGYRVLKADNAQTALAILRSGLPIDMLFTDVVMPGSLRSPELAREAKHLHPAIAVLFTSGYTQDAMMHDGRLDPGVELLSKPYSREKLARKVRHVLANRAQAGVPVVPRGGTGVPAHGSAPQRRRVLVVEDHAALLDMTCELLRTLGQDARGVGNAEQALAACAQESFDVLFTDIDLPGCSGVELARHAKARQPSIEVVFASGYGAPGGDSLGFPFAVLPKPYKLDQLSQMLAALPGPRPLG